MRTNVRNWESAASIVVGVGLVYLARRQRLGRAAAATGVGLLAHGVTGLCLVNKLVGRGVREQDTKQALGGPRGVHVRESITINWPVPAIYRLWRDLENLPRFMSHLDAVRVRDDRRSHWVARGPTGICLDWEAEIINDIENELIAWRSRPGSDVVSAGSVHFRPAPNGGTEIRVDLQYSPPARKLGALIAKLFGKDAAQQIRDDLRRLKQQLESGKWAMSERQVRFALDEAEAR